MRATRVDADGSGWRVETSAGPLTADAVVVASGYSHTPDVPDWPCPTHSPAPSSTRRPYREPSPYAGQRVLVVGSGNSAGDLVTDLVGVAGEVIMAVRTPPNIVRRDTGGVPSQLIGIASDPLPDSAEEPDVGTAAQDHRPGPQRLRTAVPRPGRASASSCAPGPCPSSTAASSTPSPLAGSGSCRPSPASPTARSAWPTAVEIEVDTVLAATGYRTGLPPLARALRVLDERGLPLVSGGQGSAAGTPAALHRRSRSS